MLLAAVGGRALWYLTRGTGVTALCLLTASVALGILEVRRWQSPRWPRFVTAGLHRYLSMLSVAFVAVHVGTTVLDGFAPIGWLDAVIPFRSPYRPVWLGLGAVALDLLIALIVTSLLRGRLGYRAWRAVHWVAYACWPVAFVHGLGTGTDVHKGWALVLNGACFVFVVGALWWRLAGAWDASRPSARVGSTAAGARVVAVSVLASVVMPVAIVVWLVTGPLQPGWVRRAGTPAPVGHSPTPARAVADTPSPSAVVPATTRGPTVTAPIAPRVEPGAPTPASSAFNLPATAQLTGKLTQAGGVDGEATVTIDTVLTDPAADHLVVVLHGRALSGGGIAMSTSQVTMGPPGGPVAYQGTVTGLHGPRLTLALSGPGGPVVMAVRLAVGADGTVSGTMTKEESGG